MSSKYAMTSNVRYDENVRYDVTLHHSGRGSVISDCLVYKMRLCDQVEPPSVRETQRFVFRMLILLCKLFKLPAYIKQCRDKGEVNTDNHYHVRMENENVLWVRASHTKFVVQLCIFLLI